VKDLRLAIAWKDIFAGALSVHLTGIRLESQLDDHDLTITEDETVWFDAISESIYETVQVVGELESKLEFEVADLISEDESASVSSDSQPGFDMSKSLLKNIIRDVSVQVKDITCTIKTSKTTTIQAHIDRVLLKDDTEELRAFCEEPQE